MKKPQQDSNLHQHCFKLKVLILQGKVEEGRKALRRLLGPDYNVDDELQIILDDLEDQRSKTLGLRPKENHNRYSTAKKIKVSNQSLFLYTCYSFSQLG